MRHLLAVVMSFLLVSGGLAVATPSALAYTPDNEELTFLALINDYRGQNGLPALSLNLTLGEAADFHSQDMATSGYFEHTAPGGTTFDQNIRNFGYGGDTMGENIAAGMETAVEALGAWQSSPEHNAGMLNPGFNEIGIGRYYEPNSQYGWYWTTTFGGDGNRRGATEITTDGVDNSGAQVQPAAADTVLAEPEITVSEETGNGRVVETQQEVPGVANADGQSVTANPGSGPANGDGQTTVYPDINTGGVNGDSVTYDQTLTAPTINSAPVTETAPAAAPVAAAPVEQEPPAQQQTTTTTYTDDSGTVTDTFSSNIEEGNGRASELGNIDNTTSSSTSGTVTTNVDPTTTTDPTLVNGPETAPVTDQAVDPAAIPATDPALAGTGCANYGTWYDAQVAYETAGGTAADPGFVNSLDPNWDGVACEELMAY